MILDAALLYASRGWHVLPLHHVLEDGSCPCPKTDCKSQGKHPIETAWQNMERLDPDEVRAAWERHPKANVGLGTGDKSGIWILDEDPDNGGDVALTELEAKHGPLPPTYTVRTGSGGRHFYFLMPDDFEIKCSSVRLPDGLDVRGNGGQVVAPPSVSVKGAYEVIEDLPPSPAPEWLLDYLRPMARPARPEPQVEVEFNPDDHKDELADYARYIMGLELDLFKQAPEGKRNTRLNLHNFNVATIIPSGAISEWEVRETFMAAGAAAGLDDDEIEATVESATTKGIAKPRVWPPRSWVPKELRAKAKYPLRSWDDIGNAERLIDHFGDRLRWVESAQKWAIYEDGVWSFGGAAAAFAEEMLRLLPSTEALGYKENVPEGDDAPDRAMFLKWVKTQRFAAKVKALLATASHQRVLRAELTDFDANPWLLNACNGTVDLRTGELLPHDPADLQMMQVPFDYDPLAGCPTFMAFLDRMQPDPERRNYIQRIAGYSITGSIREQAFFLHHGGTANGKSVFFDTVGKVLGDYNQIVPQATLIASQHEGGVPNDVARMVGRRFLQASETAAGKRLDEEKVKSLTGGEKVTARFMRAEFFDFTPTGKIHLATNHRPSISSAASIWRRMHLISWPVTVPDAEQEQGLALRIVETEGPGVLAWLVRGCLAWQAEGLAMPDSVRQERSEYQQEEDVLGTFLRERCEEKDGHRETVDVMYETFGQWCHEAGIQRPWTRQAFGKAMKDAGVETWRSNTHRGYTGYRILGFLETRTPRG